MWRVKTIDGSQSYISRTSLLPVHFSSVVFAKCHIEKHWSRPMLSVRQILEKCREFYVDTHHLLVDSQAVYDSVIRSELWNTMMNFGKFDGRSKISIIHLQCFEVRQLSLAETWRRINLNSWGCPRAWQMLKLYNLMVLDSGSGASTRW